VQTEPRFVNTETDLHIFFPITEGPYGGANQFFKALREALRRRGRYAEEVTQARVVLFNSHHSIGAVLQMRRHLREAIFIHRIDGPMRVYNAPSDKRDFVVELASRNAADATLFQSQWSRRTNLEWGWKGPPYWSLIRNSPDGTIFNREGRPPPPDAIGGRKIRVLASSWSTNPQKGFDVYADLDRRLDLDRFDMTFVGNSPIRFGRISMHPPMDSRSLAAEMKRHDIYLSASRNETCSNAVNEALACGLPVVSIDSGGTPELVGEGGLLFENPAQIIACLETVAGRYRYYCEHIAVPTIEETAGRYLAFAEHLDRERAEGRLRPKTLSALGLQIALWKLRILER